MQACMLDNKFFNQHLLKSPQKELVKCNSSSSEICHWTSWCHTYIAPPLQTVSVQSSVQYASYIDVLHPQLALFHKIFKHHSMQLTSGLLQLQCTQWKKIPWAFFAQPTSKVCSAQWRNVEMHLRRAEENSNGRQAMQCNTRRQTSKKCYTMQAIQFKQCNTTTSKQAAL